MPPQRTPQHPFHEFDKMTYEELTNSELCYLCLVSRIPLVYALHPRDHMVEGPLSSDSMCWHCHDTEEEFGHLRLGTRIATAVFGLIDQFDRYRQQRLNRA